MTTKLITAGIIALALFLGYNLFLYYEKIDNEKYVSKQEAEAAAAAARHLPGLPQGLEGSLEKARANGVRGLEAWLKAYGSMVQDPRKAAIELDYVMLLSRENPAEARRIFAEVKARTRESSPVYKRVKELEKTYE